MSLCFNATSLHCNMPVKDYYKILNLAPGAGEEEIKKHFRRLAKQYHPDTNRGRKHADAWYREIQEAYEVLSDPRKKSQYLQERWLLKSKGLPFEDTIPLTPEFIELRFKTMRKNVAMMDHFRMDHQALQKTLMQLTNDDTLDALREYYDQEANGKIIHHILYCMEPLEYRYIGPLRPILYKISGNNDHHQYIINNWYTKRRQQDWWDRKQGWIIAIVTILLCAGIAIFTQIKSA
jgi:molecular chaperone DnaJ